MTAHPSLRVRWRLCAVASAMLLASCTGSLSHLHPIPSTTVTEVSECSPSAACTSEFTFTYLGVGGFILRADSEAVMTGPSFTHPGIVSVGTPVLGRVHSEPGEIDRQIRRLLGDRFDTTLARVHSVLIGHSHYDHAMDVPHLMRRYLPTARVVGGTTTRRILVGDQWMRDSAQFEEIPLSAAATAFHIGKWVAVGAHMRVMALQSSHAPNFLGLTIATGHASKDYDHLPGTAWGWLMGDPYAYLIDVLDARGRPVFRVFYQDAAADPAHALLPPLPEPDQRPVDVAIICAGNYESADKYPTILAGALHPKYLIVGHWEDFFHSMDDEPTPIRFTNTVELENRLDIAMDRRWFTLGLGGQLRVRYPGTDQQAAGR